jgi:hypothetical protein
MAFPAAAAAAAAHDNQLENHSSIESHIGTMIHQREAPLGQKSSIDQNTSM